MTSISKSAVLPGKHDSSSRLVRSVENVLGLTLGTVGALHRKTDRRRCKTTRWKHVVCTHTIRGQIWSRQSTGPLNLHYTCILDISQYMKNSFTRTYITIQFAYMQLVKIVICCSITIADDKFWLLVPTIHYWPNTRVQQVSHCSASFLLLITWYLIRFTTQNRSTD